MKIRKNAIKMTFLGKKFNAICIKLADTPKMRNSCNSLKIMKIMHLHNEWHGLCIKIKR
jgi:hypothetical protein